MTENPKWLKKSFTILLSDEDRVEVTFERRGSIITSFSVQYLARIRGYWHPLVRFDTAHGYPHMDINYPDGTKETRSYPFYDYNSALTYAIAYVKEHWQRIREEYERAILWTDKSNFEGTTNC